MLLGLDQYTSTTHNKVIQKDIDTKLAQIRFEYTSLVASTTAEAEQIIIAAKATLDAELAKIDKKYKRLITNTAKKFSEELETVDVAKAEKNLEKARKNREKLEEMMKNLR